MFLVLNEFCVNLKSRLWLALYKSINSVFVMFTFFFFFHCYVCLVNSFDLHIYSMKRICSGMCLWELSCRQKQICLKEAF